MVSICFYFQVHQPYRLKRYSIFDIGESHDYFDDAKNQEIMRNVTAAQAPRLLGLCLDERAAQSHHDRAGLARLPATARPSV